MRTSGAPGMRTIADAMAVIAMYVEKKIGSVRRLPSILPALPKDSETE